MVKLWLPQARNGPVRPEGQCVPSARSDSVDICKPNWRAGFTGIGVAPGHNSAVSTKADRECGAFSSGRRASRRDSLKANCFRRGIRDGRIVTTPDYDGSICPEGDAVRSGGNGHHAAQPGGHGGSTPLRISPGNDGAVLTQCQAMTVSSGNGCDIHQLSHCGRGRGLAESVHPPPLNVAGSLGGTSLQRWDRCNNKDAG